MKHHKDKGELIKITAKYSAGFVLLPWKKDELWLFMGSETDAVGREWWRVEPAFTAPRKPVRFEKKKNQSWKQAIEEKNYSVEVVE